MTIELSAPFRPYIGAGGVLSVSTGVSEQAIYWELVSWDPVTLTEGVAYGSLRYNKNKTDKAGFATNVYIAPTDSGLVGKIDRIKVKCGEAEGVDFVSQSLSPSLSPSRSPSLSSSLSPSIESDPPNEAFLYHFDGSMVDTGDFDIVLNIHYGLISPSPSASLSPSESPSPSAEIISYSPSISQSLSPSVAPPTYANGIAKTNSAIVMDGTFGFQTEPSENLYPYTGNKCFLFETVFQIDALFSEDYVFWPMPGMPYDTHDNLPFLFLEFLGSWYVYFEAAGGKIRFYEEASIVPGTWYHIIAQYDAVTSLDYVYGSIYINGALLINESGSHPVSYPQGTPDNRFDIGYHVWYPEYIHFKGKLDLCRMITNIQPWTPEEVAARYAALLAGA